MKRNLRSEIATAVDRCDPEKVSRLLAEGADPNTVGGGPVSLTQQTLLWAAVRMAAMEGSKAWVDLSGALTEALQTARHDHAEHRHGYIAIIKALIGGGANIEQPCFGSTPLRQAVCKADAELVAVLLSGGANPNAETFSPFAKSPKGRRGKAWNYWNTVLHEAVDKGSLPIAEALLTAGADPNRTDHEGKTPLAIAQEKGFKDLVAMLQSRTAVHSPRPSGAQPPDVAWRAASEGRLSVLQQLIANGASVNATDAEKATPLHKAAAAGQIPVVKWLAEHGAKLNAKMRNRSTPLLLAADAGQTDVVTFLVLLKADVEAAERGGHTPFTAAVVNEHLEIADFLLRHGANPNHRTEAILNMTALMHVAGQKLLKAVEFLLAAGADATLCDARGQNALHHAVSGAVAHKVVDIGPDEDLPEGPPENALPIIERLLASGADPNVRDEEGKTPLNYARKLRLTQIVSVLEKAKVSP
jgi:ankyrin repeat protein